MEQRVFDIIFKGDEITWQSLLHDLVRVENMDPWNLDVSELAHKYIGMLKKMQEMDLRISGKVVLAAAILLKIKSSYLLEDEITNLDKLLHPEEFTEDALYENANKKPVFNPEGAKLIPRTPQPRRRKVSILELVEALRQALEVKNRRREILEAVTITVPDKKVDISKLIEELYAKIEKLLDDNGSITYSQIAPENKKEAIAGVFLPLLHLSNEHKIDMEQQTHFGEIDIMLHQPDKEIKTGSAVNEVPDLGRKHDFIGDALDEADKPKRRKKNG